FVLDHLRFADRLKTGAFQETLDGGVGRADAGALLFFADIGGLGWEIGDSEAQTARRRKGRARVVLEPVRAELLLHQLVEILFRPLLHAGRDLFAEEFDEELRHSGSLPSEPHIPSLNRAPVR